LNSLLQERFLAVLRRRGPSLADLAAILDL